MMVKLHKRAQGAASLITVIFVSIILSILVLGFVRVALDETRQSTDDDLTTRAFYAAESGIEDAKRALKQYASNPSALNHDSCAPPVGYTGLLSVVEDFDVAYSCMLIELTPTSYEATITPGQVKQIELEPEPGSSFDTILVKWHINASNPDGDGDTPPLRGTAVSGVSEVPKDQLPDVDNWYQGPQTSTYPAMLRANLFSYPNGSFVNADTDNSAVAFLNPTGNQNDGTITHVNGQATGINYGLHEADCDNSVLLNEYVCSQVFDGFSTNTNNYVMRIQGIYAPTHVKVTMLDGGLNGTAVGFNKAQVIVDVTGRAGDVFRRVEARLDLEDLFSTLVPEYAILSADDICKDLVVGNSASSSSANDCSLAP